MAIFPLNLCVCVCICTNGHKTFDTYSENGVCISAFPFSPFADVFVIHFSQCGLTLFMPINVSAFFPLRFVHSLWMSFSNIFHGIEIVSYGNGAQTIKWHDLNGHFKCLLQCAWRSRFIVLTIRKWRSMLRTHELSFVISTVVVVAFFFWINIQRYACYSWWMRFKVGLRQKKPPNRKIQLKWKR